MFIYKHSYTIANMYSIIYDITVITKEIKIGVKISSDRNATTLTGTVLRNVRVNTVHLVSSFNKVSLV